MCAAQPSSLPRRCSWRRRPAPPTSWSGGRKGSTLRRTRRFTRSSPPSSRRPASRSSSPSIPRTSSRTSSGGDRGRPPAGLRLRHPLAGLPRPVGLRGSAGRPRGRSRRLLGPVRSGRARRGHLAQCADRARRAVRAADGSRDRTTSTSGRACSSGRASRSPIFRKEWEAFWSFWCDQVQPAVRKATRPRRHLGRRPAHVGAG